MSVATGSILGINQVLTHYRVPLFPFLTAVVSEYLSGVVVEVDICFRNTFFCKVDDAVIDRWIFDRSPHVHLNERSDGRGCF